MDKNKTLNDFLVLNKSLITNMESQSPEIKNAFDLVLEQIKAKFEIVEPIASSIKKEFKVGDKVFIPSTISGNKITDLSLVTVIEKATENNYEYLIISRIQTYGSAKQYILTDIVLTPSAVYFEEQDLVPYVQLKVGDKVKIPTTWKHTFDLNSVVVKEAIVKGQDYLYIQKIDTIFCTLSLSFEEPSMYSSYYLNDLNLVPYEEPMQLSTNLVKLYTTEDKKEIPQEIVDKMLENQLAQAGKKDINVFVENINMGKSGGGFNYNETNEGHPFWFDIVVAGDFDKFYEKYPKTKTSKFKVGDKVKIPTTNGFGIDLALSIQIEKAKNDGQDYLLIRRIDFEGDYVLTAQNNFLNGELFKEEDLELYEEPTQVIATPKAFNPYDLVGKTLRYNGRTYLIITLVKINPKNIVYEFELSDGKKEKFNVPKTVAQKWLQGEYYANGRIVDGNATAPNQTQAQQPTQTATTTPTKEWTPNDLVGKILQFPSGKRYIVDRLVKNNPKYKVFYLSDESTNRGWEYKFLMADINNWLNGNKYRGVMMVGTNVVSTQTTTQPSVLAPTTFTKPFDFQVGDMVALPTSLNGVEKSQSEMKLLSKQVNDAIESGKDMMFVRRINYKDGTVNLAKSSITGNSDTFYFADIKPYEEPIKATAPIVVQTKVEGDYSTYSQFDLKEEKNEIEATLPYLDEDDEEYTELKLKLDMIDLWLD